MHRHIGRLPHMESGFELGGLGGLLGFISVNARKLSNKVTVYME
jgi:hypothetical protein